MASAERAIGWRRDDTGARLRAEFTALGWATERLVWMRLAARVVAGDAVDAVLGLREGRDAARLHQASWIAWNG
jgi:hypothetical protein